VRQYIIRRILIAIPLILAITVINYAVGQLAPGDPLSNYIDPNFSQEMREAALEQMGYNRPVVVQYFAWLREAVRGNLGYSSRFTSQKVVALLVERMGPTLILTLPPFLIAFLIAVPIGVYSALRQYSAQDTVFTVFAYVGMSIPSFFLALGLIYIFALRLGWFPVAGLMTIGPGGGTVVDRLRHLALPWTAQAVMQLAGLARHTRSSMLEVLRQDYVRTARSKGLTERVVIYKHALRNALIPIVTIIGGRVAVLFGGSMLIERVFSYPGLGLFGYSAVMNRDYPVLMGLVLITATMIIIGNLVADISYALVDPRVRLE
jgi:peptide/nickel transport system permease protein